MNVDDARLMAQLTLHEGRRRKPYVDSVGKITIGIGHNLTDLGVSERVIDLIYFGDVETVFRELDAAAPWVTALSDVRQRVVYDMAFNLGVPRLMKFRQTLDALRARRFELAAVKMLESKWADQVGARSRRLAEMMASGQDSTDF